MTLPPHVFISYARPDEEHARVLAEDLRRLGLPVWLDVERLLPGDHWDRTIQEALRTSSYCVVLLSSNTVDPKRKRYVTRELGWALNMSTGRLFGDRFCIPLRLEPVDVNDKYLARHHYIDLYPERDEGLRRLQQAMPEWARAQGDRVAFLSAVYGAACPLAVLLIAMVAVGVVARWPFAEVVSMLKGFGELSLMLVFGVPIFVMLAFKTLSSKRQVFVAALIVCGSILLLLFGAALAA